MPGGTFLTLAEEGEASENVIVSLKIVRIEDFWDTKQLEFMSWNLELG